MARRKQTNDPPASVPAVVTPSRADWSDWSADHERRRIEAEIEERRKVVDAPIFPREIARTLAQDAARTMVPDWKLLRVEHRTLFVKLLRDQPELQQREVRQMDSLLNLINANLPTRLQPLLRDLRTILELRLLAHEGAAFLVGVETGRVMERQYTDARRPTSHQTTHASRAAGPGRPDREPFTAGSGRAEALTIPHPARRAGIPSPPNTSIRPTRHRFG